MVLEWTPALAVGIEEIDAQHRELFRRANRLVEGLRDGDAGEIGELVDYLHRYAIGHFGAEEAEMRSSRYPGYARHKAEHDRFIGELLEIAGELDAEGGGARLSSRVGRWLRGWVEAHVSGTDAELGRFLRRRRT